MKTLFAAAAALVLLASAASAVTWDIVSVSVVVRQGNATGNIFTTVQSSRSYLTAVSTRFATPVADLFIGFREDTGVVAVVRKSDKTVLYNIVSGLGTAGAASNGLGTLQFFSGGATVSSTNTDFSGFYYDTVSRFANASIRTLNRQFLGGTGNQTIRGTIVSTGRKLNL